MTIISLGPHTCKEILAVMCSGFPTNFEFNVFSFPFFAKIQRYKLYLVKDSPKLVYVNNPTIKAMMIRFYILTPSSLCLSVSNHFRHYNTGCIREAFKSNKW